MGCPSVNSPAQVPSPLVNVRTNFSGSQSPFPVSSSARSSARFRSTSAMVNVYSDYLVTASSLSETIVFQNPGNQGPEFVNL